MLVALVNVSVSGFLYFEGVRPDVDCLGLRADLRNAHTGRDVARLEISFEVG